MFFHTPLRRIVIITIVLFVAVIGAYSLFRYLHATEQQSETATVQPRPLATVTENDVTVTIAFERDAGDHPWLVGTFTPLREHFHLYSKDIPKSGVNGVGVGRPTRLEIASEGPVKAIGELMTAAPLEYHYTRSIEQGVPIYREGAVVLRLPIAYSPHGTPIPTDLSVTYMACSDTICLTPVIDKHVAVMIP